MRHIIVFITIMTIFLPVTSATQVTARNMIANAADKEAHVIPPLCEDPVIKDDGTAETGYGWVPSAVEGIYVQEFHSSEFPEFALDSVCICWMRTTEDDEIDFDVVIYGDDRGQPLPTPRHRIPAHATGVPEALDGAFTEVDVGHLQLGTGTFYIGVSWDPSVDQYFFVCADQSVENEAVDGWYIDDRADGWSSLLTTSDPIFEDHRAMMIRPVGGLGFVPELPTMGTVGIFIFIGVLAVFAMLILRRRDETQ